MRGFFISIRFRKAAMPWLLNDPKPAASALYMEFQTQAFSDILLNSTNDNTPRKHTTTVAAGDDEGRLLAWKTAQETSKGHGNTSWLGLFYSTNLEHYNYNTAQLQDLGHTTTTVKHTQQQQQDDEGSLRARERPILPVTKSLFIKHLQCYSLP